MTASPHEHTGVVRPCIGFWPTLLSAALLFGSLAAVEGAPAKKKSSGRSSGTTRPVARPTIETLDLAQFEGDLPLAAVGATVVDGFTGRVIYEKNSHQRLYPASATKVLTALLVIESGNLDQEVAITWEDSQVGESSLNIREGDVFTRRQMLYGLMLKSANDVAHALARDNAGTMPAFADKMTQRAREVGALDSHFMNPHGLHHKEHYTTAYDLAMITRAAMDQPFFRRIVSTQAHPWVSPTMPLMGLRNHNRLLGTFPGCTGVKTGFTRPAGQVLASAALREGREVVATVMLTDKPGIWEDSKILLTYGLLHLPSLDAAD